MVQTQILSRNQQIVLDIIEKAKGPLKAYSILGGLLSVVLGLFTSLEFNTSSGTSIIAASLFLFILSLLNIKQSIKLKN